MVAMKPAPNPPAKLGLVATNRIAGNGLPDAMRR